MSSAQGIEHVGIRFVELMQHLLYRAFSECLRYLTISFLDCEPVLVNMLISLENVLENQMKT
jgi:hypothetical protein